MGTWSPKIDWASKRGFAIHLALMPDQRLIMWNWRKPESGTPDVPFCVWTLKKSDDDQVDNFRDLQVDEVPFDSLTQNHYQIFCAGMCWTYDGRLFTAGGHRAVNIGAPGINIFDPVENAWEFAGTMSQYPESELEPSSNGRWYPTCFQLANRQIIILSGARTISSGHVLFNNYPEIWSAGVGCATDYISRLTDRARPFDRYYPHTFTDPLDGNLIVLGADSIETSGLFHLGYQMKMNLDTLATTYPPRFQVPAGLPNVQIDYPSAVMIDGVILRTGGSGNSNENLDATPAVSNAIYVDMKTPVRMWKQAGYKGMVLPRKNHTLVALPDGQVLAMGGCFKRNNPPGISGAVIEGAVERATPEIWDMNHPATSNWRLLASPPADPVTHLVTGRGYHSTALLLPDAKILFAGGETEGLPRDINQLQKESASIFSPPYGGLDDWESLRPGVPELLFAGNDHAIIHYGESMQMRFRSTTGKLIDRLTLIPIGSTTHAFNTNQTTVFLHKPEDGPLPLNRLVRIDAPASPFLASPGYYMLFAVDTAGIPSPAAIIQLKDLDPFVAGGAPLEYHVLEGASIEDDDELGVRLRIGDNKYFGQGIASSRIPPYEIVMTAQLTGNNVDASRIRALIESSASRSSALEVSIWNNAAGQWDLLDPLSSATIGTSDRTLEFNRSSNSPSRDYLKRFHVDSRMTLKLKWTSARPFTVRVDKVEGGVL